MNEKLLYFLSSICTKYINLLGNKNYSFERILVIKLDEIGDLVTALPVFYNIHNKYPKAQITVLCKPFNAIFFKNIEYVNCIHDLDSNSRKYDLILDLRGNEQTLRYALSSRPYYRLDRGSIRFKNKLLGGQKNEIDTNLEVISPLIDEKMPTSNAIHLSPKETIKVDKFIEQEGLNEFVIIHAGARDKARRWPIDRFQEIIKYINERYSMSCMLVGGEDDRELNDQCLSGVQDKNNRNVVGTFDLIEYAALCSKASLFIGNESGPLHIAAAQNTPNIALFGPGVKNVFYPKNDKSIVHHYFLANGHKNQTIENSTIFSITTSEVKQSIDQLLS
ncbi:glycosyltransferase family 9 protein [Bacteroidia bacterium]|nr:glycosyltransferase family 9 protein [Bacteroidia bacterium]MDC0561614.1 glycosyltransferase family 9 protein [Bacteroidia bacterium]MDC3406568.1 glycosyltransferase family 9 protein [Bacteroidia bacterium]